MNNVDNHMDDLFRKAADNYPLNTTNGNWDNLQSLLNNQQSDNTLNFPNRKPFFFFIAFAFILIGLITSTVLKNNIVVIKIAENNSNVKVVARSLDTNLAPNPAHNNGMVMTGVVKKKVEQLHSKQMIDKSVSRVSYSIVSKNTLTGKSLYHQPDISDGISIRETNVNNITNSVQPKENRPLPLPVSLVAEDSNSLTLRKDNRQIIDTAFIDNKEENNKSNNNKANPKFYYSLGMGLEYGQVKNQGFTKPGWNIGLFAGLQFNKRISIETGLQLSQKKYFTSALYFKPKSGSMPSDMVVNSLNGESSLIEVPLNLKYNIQKRNNTLYFLTGLSSYLIAYA